MSITLDEAFRAVIRAEVEAALDARGLALKADYYNQNNNPLGKRRFLEAARRGDFPSSKDGKLVLARRDDVDRWLASRTRPSANREKEDRGDDVDALLAGAGIVASGVTSPRRRRSR